MSWERRRKARGRRASENEATGGVCSGPLMESGASRFLRKGAVEGARRDGVRVSGSFASSPQPALVRVAARGQPSGHLASGGGAAGSDEEAGAVLEASWKRMGEGLEEWRAAERKLWEQVRWSRGAFEALARARSRRPLY